MLNIAVSSAQTLSYAVLVSFHLEHDMCLFLLTHSKRKLQKSCNNEKWMKESASPEKSFVQF